MVNVEPFYGYLILAYRLYKNPFKYSGPWNFGTERSTVTSVKYSENYLVVREI